MDNSFKSYGQDLLEGPSISIADGIRRYCKTPHIDRSCGQYPQTAVDVADNFIDRSCGQYLQTDLTVDVADNFIDKSCRQYPQTNHTVDLVDNLIDTSCGMVSANKPYNRNCG